MKKVLSVFFTMIIIFIVASLSAFSADAEWDGSIKAPGKMVANDGVYYYEISTAEELAYIAKTGGDWLGYNYILTADICLNDTELTVDEHGNLTADTSSLNEWTPIDDFNGIFDGNGFSVSGIYVDVTDSAGFFSKLSGSVKNLTIENAYIRGGTYVGGICGRSSIAGKCIANCTFNGTVIGTDCVAGITGYTDGYNGSNITDCTNNGNIRSSGGKTGGIVGNAGTYTASVQKCVNNGSVISDGDNVGGICGYYFWTVYDCVNNGSVTGNNNVGGICGYKHVPIGNSINNGNVKGNNCIGGIVGYSTSDSNGENVHNTGTVSGEAYVGGICGYGTGRDSDDYFTLKEASNIGDVKGDSYVGGLIGYTYNTNVYDSYSTGNVVGNTSVGAFIGHSESVWGRGEVKNCYYLKTDSVNPNLTGFGNAGDYEGIIRDKKASFFPILSDPTSDPAFKYLGYKNGEIDSPINSDNSCDAVCNNCGEDRGISHSTETVPAKNAECTEAGYTEGVYCNLCSNWLSGHEVIPATGHTDNNGDNICDVCSKSVNDISVGE
ncbi:MAG: hypothetical protein IKV21_00755, partial [Clostridia bacterium]|nr:hypothetical protein [Clostridia bacterium]